MRIAIFIYNRTNMYSGGQYHAFILGKAIAQHQHNVDFYWNHPPIFSSEFAEIHTTHYNFLMEFDSAVFKYDYVIVAPSGLYVPDFYERAMELASKCSARICLLNYESENWFNGLAPTQDDYRVWDYWRRVLSFGGLVISTTKEGDRLAREFYHSPDDLINFETLRAPINSICAGNVRSENLKKDGSIVVFVRRQHDYKGTEDLLKINPEIFVNRTLHIVFGGDIDHLFSDELEMRYAGHNVNIVYHNRIPVKEKFKLLAKAQLLLFLSYFEGFGYPPVEAFVVGTEVVCYDLPVLRENLKHLPVYAPVGNIEQLEKALAKALLMDRETSHLVEHAEALSGFDKCGKDAVKILEVNSSIIKPVTGYTSLLWWGPFNNEQALAFPALNFKVPYPVFVSNITNNGTGVFIEIKAVFENTVINVVVDTEVLELQLKSIAKSIAFPGWNQYIYLFQAKTPGSGTITFHFSEELFHREIFEIKHSTNKS